MLLTVDEDPGPPINGWPGKVYYFPPWLILLSGEGEAKLTDSPVQHPTESDIPIPVGLSRLPSCSRSWLRD